MEIRRVCVFCGSSAGRKPGYAAAARALGRMLAERGHGVVYGGASVGLMAEVADAALAAGGEVIGVIPEVLAEREVAHGGLTELRVVGSMHERKRTMFELSNAFVALPGGLGTLEEVFEMATWAQLGLHAYPIGILDLFGYYAQLVGFLDHAVDEGLLRPEHRHLLLVDDDPRRLLDRMSAWEPAALAAVLGRRQT